VGGGNGGLSGVWLPGGDVCCVNEAVDVGDMGDSVVAEAAKAPSFLQRR
jgi:hypothetical protein